MKSNKILYGAMRVFVNCFIRKCICSLGGVGGFFVFDNLGIKGFTYSHIVRIPYPYGICVCVCVCSECRNV